MILFLLAAVLLLAKSDGRLGQRVEVRSSNSNIEVVGFDGDRVTVEDGAVQSIDGRVVVRGDGPLKVQVPRCASLDIVTSNGEIRVSGVAGAMRLTTSNAAIVVDNAGGREIHAHTSNGRIEVGVPRGLGADVSARTSNARIHADIAMVTRHIGENLVEGKTGKGGPVIDLQTSNGAIYLKSPGDRESVSSTFSPAEVK
jgi:DUF4097 and DUF4098 domain-containing protein YvlB